MLWRIDHVAFVVLLGERKRAHWYMKTFQGLGTTGGKGEEETLMFLSQNPKPLKPRSKEAVKYLQGMLGARTLMEKITRTYEFRTSETSKFIK